MENIERIKNDLWWRKQYLEIVNVALAVYQFSEGDEEYKKKMYQHALYFSKESEKLGASPLGIEEDSEFNIKTQETSNELLPIVCNSLVEDEESMDEITRSFINNF